MLVARPYAKAAFEFASEQKTIKAWQDYFSALKILFENKDFEALLANPHVDEMIIADALNEAGKWPPAQSNFLKILAEAHRLQALPEIAKAFAELIQAQQKIRQAYLIVKEAPGEEEVAAIKARLKGHFNEEIDLQVKVDPRILGGAMVVSDDFVLDGSLQGRLARLRKELTI